MRIGVFVGSATASRTSVPELLANAREAEAHGFTTAWVPHMPWSLDALNALTLASTVTERIELGTAVVPTFPRHPIAMAQEALTVQAASGGRLLLGIGPSHRPVIERMLGIPYEQPAANTEEYVEVLRRAFQAGSASEQTVDYDGSQFRVHAMLEVPGSTPPSLMVAALGPRMLDLAGRLTDGTITYWADERAIGEHVAPRITAAATAAGRPAPRVVAGMPVAVVDDVDAAKAEVHQMFADYRQLDIYRRILDHGSTGQPGDVAIVGTERDVRARLQAFADAGATDICAAVLGLGDEPARVRDATLDVLASLNAG